MMQRPEILAVINKQTVICRNSLGFLHTQLYEILHDKSTVVLA